MVEREVVVKKLSSSKQPASSNHSDSITVDPDSRLLPNDVADFNEIHKKFDDVFNPNFTGYNGAYGPIKATVNMGPVLPPQRKGRVPQYSRNKLEDLQKSCDDLEKLGVLRKPEDVGVKIEYTNPSFLVKKTVGHRLVTAFAEVGRYAKPQPSMMPNVDSVLREIAKWKYIITTDITKAFYQIPLDEESMKYCGTATPFKGLRLYTPWVCHGLSKPWICMVQKLRWKSLCHVYSET